jgi:YkoY family integral membrane protein
MWGFSLVDVALVAWYIGVLVLLEGLLSADNALVLAVMVRHLPKKQQREVLFYGIWGAVGFRFAALLSAAILLKFWMCKVIGGGYLLYLALAHFWSQRSGRSSSPGDTAGAQAPQSRPLSYNFWGTVTSITMADIAFSIDSILAAVAMAEGFPPQFGDTGKLLIVFTGGVLGIITMRFVVRYFLMLLDRFPGLAEGAYYLVAWIGLKLFINGLHVGAVQLSLEEYMPYHVPEWLFWAGMILIAAISLVVKPRIRPGDEEDLLATCGLLEEPNDLPNAGESEELGAGPDNPVDPI